VARTGPEGRTSTRGEGPCSQNGEAPADRRVAALESGCRLTSRGPGRRRCGSALQGVIDVLNAGPDGLRDMILAGASRE